MPFLGPEASTSISWNGIVDAGTHATSTASTDALPGAATWPPSAASLSTAQSHMDSSAPVGITEINLVSSPPTSHATSPLRPSARNNLPSPSELRAGSKAAISTATAARLEGAFVANSDPEDGGEIEADGADTPRDRSRSPEQVDVPESTVYVQLPASSPSMAVHSGSASRRKNKGASGSDSPKRRRRGSKSSETSRPGASSVVDDAALAAQLAAQEAALARRRPTRGSRKDVSYSPVCDLDGKPLRKKQAAAAAPASSSASTSKDKSKRTTPTRKASGKRRSRVFSDDEDEDEHADAGSSSAAPAKALAAEKEGGGEEQHDADLTDEDVGFQACDRKKPRKSKPGRAEETQEPDVARAEASTPGNKGKARRRHDEEEEMHSDASGGDGDDGILTPPAPTSPRRKSGKRNASPEVQAAEPDTNSAASGVQMAKTQSGDEDEQEKGDSAASPRSSAASAEAAASGRKTPATVAIKRVGTTSSPSASPSTRSFFGKPLTSLLTGTVRRPGLTRKTNIPSLLAHRAAPKPPAPKLAVSKRRMQDDDYEYDAAYEALIAKPEPDSSDSDEPAPNQVEYEEEYD